MYKILHISDLHICAEEIAPAVRDLKKSCENIFGILVPGIPFDFAMATQVRLNALEDLVWREGIKAICITGDITTFGDKESFKLASDFFASFEKRGIKIITCPGNHDVLSSHLNNLRSSPTFDKIYKFVIEGSVFPVIKAGLKKFDLPYVESLDEIENSIKKIKEIFPVSQKEDDVLSEYNSFVMNSNISKDFIFDSVDIHNSKINIVLIPFNTVNIESNFVNLGVSSCRNVDNLVNNIKKFAKTDIKIVLMHHNPFSSPELVEHALPFGFNGMPSGPALMQLMQENNVDIVLYGHQHKHNYTNIRYPYVKESGIVSLLGCSSSTTGEEPSVNIINITNTHEATVSEWVSKKNQLGSSKFTSKITLPILFESKIPSDTATGNARKEIKRYSWAVNASDTEQSKESNKLWHDCILENDIKKITLLGPRHSGLSTAPSIKRLQSIIENGADFVKIIIHDPDIYREVAKLNMDIQVVNKINGQFFSWEDTSEKASMSLKSLEKLKRNLKEKGDRIKIIKTPILLTTGIRHVVKNNGDDYLVVRLIPVGSEQETAIVKLTRRNDNGMYEFYINYLNSFINVE